MNRRDFIGRGFELRICSKLETLKVAMTYSIQQFTPFQKFKNQLSNFFHSNSILKSFSIKSVISRLYITQIYGLHRPKYVHFTYYGLDKFYSGYICLMKQDSSVRPIGLVVLAFVK